VQGAEQDWIAAACRWLGFSTTHEVPEGLVASLQIARESELETLLNVVSANFDQFNSGALRLRQMMQQVAVRLNQLIREENPNVAFVAPEILVRLGDMLSAVDAIAAAHCLQMLAMQPDEESIDALAATLTEQPPEQLQAVAIALSPLWQLDGNLLALFFDRLGDGFLHPATMSALLDLANYSTRTGRLEEHPYAQRVEELLSLLGSLTQRLSLMEENPAKFGGDVESIQKVLGESVALTVSLCDSLGLIGDPQATENLKKTLSLSHRRVQTEAAGALARLGDATGKQRLIELAEDRVARLRAVTYAEEMGFAEEIEADLRLPQSMAEAELASWLASGDRFGIAPHEMELFDARTQYWPSFEAPRDCYLFRYTYVLPTGQLSNIGIAGPLTCAFNSDLGNLPADDLYAVFAGWQAEHEDIYEVPEALLNRDQRREADRLVRSLQERECDVKQILALTFFLGEIALLATIIHEGKRLHAVTDGNELLYFPASEHPTALTPDLVLAIFRGRKLLRTFNH
jgi:hypothetical protein